MASLFGHLRSLQLQYRDDDIKNMKKIKYKNKQIKLMDLQILYVVRQSGLGSPTSTRDLAGPRCLSTS